MVVILSLVLVYGRHARGSGGGKHTRDVWVEKYSPTSFDAMLVLNNKIRIRCVHAFSSYVSIRSDDFYRVPVQGFIAHEHGAVSSLSQLLAYPPNFTHSKLPFLNHLFLPGDVNI